MITDTRFPPQPYQTDGFKLDKGLNLVDPKMFIEPGSLKNCLNYEVVDRIGYKRIDGFSSFDGHEFVGDGPFWILTDESFVAGHGATISSYPLGSLLIAKSDEFGNNGETLPFGVVVGSYDVDGGGIIFSPLNYDVFPSVPANTNRIDIYGESAGNFYMDVNPTLVSKYTNGAAIIGDLPNPAIGLHWFHDKLYAFADEEMAWFTSGSDEILIGDLIEDTGGSNTFRVVDVVVDDGTWAGGDAAGAIMLEVLTGSIPTSGAIKVTRPASTTIADAGTWSTSGGTGITTLLPWKAGMWKSRSVEQAIADGDTASDAGWTKIDTGVLVGFSAGTFASGGLPTLDRETGNINLTFDEQETTADSFNTAYYNFNIAGDAAASGSTTIDATVSSGSGKTTTAAYVEGVEADDAYFLRLGFLASDNGASVVSRRLGYTACANLQDVPAYARITGVEVILTDVNRISAEVGATNPWGEMELEVGLFKYGGTSTQIGSPKFQSFSNENGSATANGSYTLGSSTDLWGETEIDVNDILDVNFGVSLKFEGQTFDNDTSSGGLTGLFISIDQIQIKVYYELEFSRYYFWDGTDDVQADLIGYYLTSGNFETGTAEGYLQFANVEEYDTAIRRSIKVGDEIHVAPGGVAASKVGDVDSIEVNAPAPKNLIDAQDSKYSIITANFYANDDYDGIYGVTGASRAFEFDGTYYLTIFTQEDATKDIPRHIAFHHYHLALGYQGGQIVFSVAGEPSNFDGVLGAVEMAVGDRITGLLPLKGATLGVFCENSIWGINGTVTDQFTTQTISPKLGAIEYTVVDMGEVVFCTSNGISTLSQTDKYGDFLGERLSYNVTPWLQPRLRRRNSSAAVAKDIVCAIPFRTKNQYRLFFKDGYVLIMTLNPDGTSEFTYAQYYKYESTDEGEEWNDPDYYQARFLVPLAWSSQVDDNGEERIHISHFSEDSSIDADGNGDYVFELEKGWGFDGEFFPSFIETNWHYQQGPFQNNTLRKVRLEGLTRGSAPLRVYTSKDYETTYSTTYTPISLPNTDLTSFLEDYIAETDMANVASRGRNVGIKIEMVPEQYPLPPHVLQALLIQFATGKPDL